jgi:hypothetical protein
VSSTVCGSHTKGVGQFRQAHADVVALSLEPDWGELNVRNPGGGPGNGVMVDPKRARSWKRRTQEGRLETGYGRWD